MFSRTFPLRQPRRRFVLLAGTLILLAIPIAAAIGQPRKVDVLRIGTSGTLASEGSPQREKAALESMKSFIKEETGLDNEIVRQKDWRELADKMAKGDLHLGVFQGYEFAWAQERQSGLKPLAVAVNLYTCPVAYVITRRDNKAKDFAGLQGQSPAMPATGQRFLNLFVERQCEANGKKPDAFFSKITTPENAEDALDDVVDGVVQATVVDRAALEAYKRRKPARFEQLKPVAQSQPFPPPVVAYYDNVVDEATRKRFLEGLLGAAGKERGQTMLTMFRLTGFERAPDDFDKVLGETRKAYPPPGTEGK
jgi:ABC-type phosphate/phosphonate transport system substrate-binding protein